MDHGAVAGAVAPSVVASTPALAAREPQLANDPIGAQDRLQLALEDHGYDLVVIDCPPSLGLLTVNGLFAADRALVVTEPGAWASDGVAQIQRTIARIASRREGRPAIAGIAVNRLGRTRDAKYWHGQLVEDYGDQVMAPVHLRAAVAEASAQSLPIHALGARPGALEAAAEFDALLDAVVPELAPPASEPDTAVAADASAAPDAEATTTPPAPTTTPPISTGEPDAVVRPATIPTPPVAH
jgi:chromosome partitioning protein